MMTGMIPISIRVEQTMLDELTREFAAAEHPDAPVGAALAQVVQQRPGVPAIASAFGGRSST